jgi:hypothetical protein
MDTNTQAETATDRIERSIVIDAPRERGVARALDAAEFGTWFGADLGASLRRRDSACAARSRSAVSNTSSSTSSPNASSRSACCRTAGIPMPFDANVDYTRETPTLVTSPRRCTRQRNHG